VALLALEVAFTARRKARRGSAAEKSGRLKAMRNYCTQRMARRFLWVLAGAVLALVSTLGQTAYAYLQSSQISGVTLFGGGGLLTGALVFIVRHLMTVFSAKPDSWLARVPLTWIATVAAAALLLAMGTLWSLAVQSALWSGGPPLAVPVMSTEDDAKQRRIEWKVHNCVYVNPARGETVEDGCGSSGVSLPNFQDQRRCWSDPVRSATHTCHPSVLQLNWLFVWLALALAVGLVIGRFMGFLNLSTLHTLYAARLTRAYLGATNRERFLEKRRADGSCVVRARAVTEPLPSDSIPLDRYYDARVSGPLHIVNVTVNKTRPSHTTLVQRDRRGVGMAIVPDGLVVNHRFWKLAGHRPNGQWSPWARTATDAEDSPVVSDGERLGLGDWIAISGAAFSTGLGERTSIGLSLLTGLVNVRLGYWWDPSVRATGTTARDNAVPWWLRWSNRWVPTYGRLHQELFAAFDGPSPEQPLWFLTDGGHFENTAVYELIRRRVGVIVCCDVGADPDYAFEDVGNLVRKARSDFGAEMTLVTGDTLKHVVRDDALRSRFGAPEDFRCKPDARTACALMFRIDYPDGASSGATRKDPARSSLLIVLKPTAVQGLPLDLQHYASAHATFPQQTTGDQFFDEAQWESYRKLGEFVASMVLNRDALDLHKGWRSRLFDPAATGAP
ncbi:MAG: hypothetical protein KIT73_06450, partial [Burkholderiales bacterium]|nr:hypothetical protein [Burkholderiales bacterium]